jgi:hypothetical protein
MSHIPHQTGDGGQRRFRNSTLAMALGWLIVILVIVFPFTWSW